MDNLPVFGSSEEYRTWKVLNGKLSDKRLDSIHSKILEADGYVHPAILIALMDALLKVYGYVSETTMKSIVSKARPQDCSPAIRATEILVFQNEITAAAQILSRNNSKDMFHRYQAEAELYHGEGDRINSVTSAKRGLDLDPSSRRLYEILKEDDPMGQWADREAVQSAYEGKQADEPDDPRLRQLYRIYSSWFSGYKDRATDLLVSSEYYKSGDWEFQLASARLSVDEKDWISAKMVYDKIMKKAPAFVSYEAAETYVSGHDPSRALDIYDELDQISVRSMQGRIAAYAQLGSANDLMNAFHDYLDNEYSGTKQYSDIIDMLVSTGNQEQAKVFLDRMAESNRKDPSYLVSYSNYLLSRGDIRGAKKASKEAMRHAKDDPAVRVMVARIKLISDDLKGAEKDCDKVLSENPDEWEALMLKKDILVKKGDVPGALTVCRRILELDSNDVSTILDLSNALSSSGDTNGAMLNLRNVLRIQPSRENVVAVVGSMIESGMYKEAMYLCYDLEKDIPADPVVRRLRGNAEYCMGDYTKASVSYAAAAELSPYDPVIWYSKGMADEARGDLESAEESYNRAVLLDLNESEYWISKAAIQEKFEDPYGAIESLNRAIELDPESVYPMVRKAAILEKAGRYDEAMYFLDLCSVTQPDNVDVALMICRVLRESGQEEKALERAQEIHNSVKSDDSAIELASCYLATGQRAGAVRIIEAAMEKSDASSLRLALDVIEGGSAAIAAEPEEPVEEVSVYDAPAAAAIAESLLAVSDYKGALRSIDRAIAIGGENAGYICIKCRILLTMSEPRTAEDLMTDAIRKDEKNPLLHEAMGDVKYHKSEYRAALQEYEKAISLGLALPEILIKKGDAQQGLGYYDRAIDSYTMAVNRDTGNLEMRLALAEKLFDRGYLSRADKQVDIILERNPGYVDAIILMAKIKSNLRKDAGVSEAYDRFRICTDTTDDQNDEMIEVLERAGHDAEANRLRKVEPEKPESTKVKRDAEKVLRRAYVSRSSPTDDDFLNSLGFEGQAMEEVKKYIIKDAPYGDIVPGSTEFQKQERASNMIILKLNWRDLEDRPRLPLAAVFVSGSFRDVDEAKRLVSYINKAMNADVIRDDSLKMVLGKVQGTSLFEIIRTCKVGVYQARQIQLLMGIQ